MIPSAIASLATLLVLQRLTQPVTRRPLAVASPPLRMRRHTRIRRIAWRVTVASLVALVFGAVVIAACGIAMWAWPRARSIVEQRKRTSSIERSLPDAIEMLILVVHAGLTPHQAIALLRERAPEPIRPGFDEVWRRIGRGHPLADALGALPDELGPSAQSIADTLAIAERHGTPIAAALEQLAHDVRERRRRAADSAARTLPIRMAFPLVTCTLPSFVLVAIVPAVLAALASLSTSGF